MVKMLTKTKKSVLGVAAAVILLACLPVIYGQDRYVMNVIILCFVWSIVAASWDLILGYAMELDKEIIDPLSEASRAAEIPVMLLPSGGAHDAVKIAKVAPAGMLFVRSFNGISHSPEEFSSSEDLADAAAVLEQALLKLAF